MKIYHLGTCSTCQRILRSIPEVERFELQDIKADPITPEQLDKLREIAGSYEALFSRKAMKYRAMGLHERELTEEEIRDLILQEYTFLKRPVILIGAGIFIGNSAKVVEAMLAAAS